MFGVTRSPMPVASFMPTPSLETSLLLDAAASDEVVIAFFRAFLPDFFFVNTPISRMRRHLQMIGALSQTPLLLDFHQPPSALFTEMTLCTSDDAAPGLLSKVAGALSHLKINIDTAWIHTLRDPNQIESGRRIALDTLILSETGRGASRALSAKTQAKVRQTLTPVLSGEISVESLVGKPWFPAAPLAIDHLSASLASEGQCEITLRAADQPALLFRIARTLAGMGFDIAHAQINTFELAVADVFFVGKAGGEAFEKDEIEGMVEDLRERLESGG